MIRLIRLLALLWVPAVASTKGPSMAFVGSWGARRSKAAVGSVSANPNDGAAAAGSPQGRQLSPPEVVASFEARPFQPAPLLRNEHLQTIWGARAVQDAMLQLISPTSLPSAWNDVYDRRERWETPDDDWFTVDYLFSTAPSSASSPSPRPVAIVLHGLESASTALLPRSMAKAYAKRGFDVVALNFRGCCGNDNLQPYAYHLGYTDDLKMYVSMHSAID